MMMIKGKGTVEMGNSSTQSHQCHTVNVSTIKSIGRPLLLDEPTLVSKKIEMPNFDGSDPVGWIVRAKQLFEIQNIFEEHKISLALVSMEGAPLHWLGWLRQRNPQLIWDQLRRELMQRYSDDISENPYEHLSL